MAALDGIFGTMRHVAWWQECLRALVVFVYGLLLLRTTGRRTFGRWSALDIVVSIVFGSSLSRALTGNAPFGGTIAAMTVLVGLHWLLARATVKSPAVSRFIEGEPIELAGDGEAREAALRQWAVSHADMAESLRGSGIDRVADAHRVMLEPSGKITVVKKA
jgi:uncharacterized membrane protein YcaP (DUF421 family)